jgi:hypothetical protein
MGGRPRSNPAPLNAGTERGDVRSARAFPVKAGSPEMLYLVVKTQFLTQNRFPLLLELL